MINYIALFTTDIILRFSYKSHAYAKDTKGLSFRMTAKIAYRELGKIDYRSNFVLALAPMSLND
jgi:hypothetical protein